MLLTICVAVLALVNLAIYSINARRQHKKLQQLLQSKSVENQLRQLTKQVTDVTTQIRIVRKQYHVGTATAIELLTRIQSR